MKKPKNGNGKAMTNERESKSELLRKKFQQEEKKNVKKTSKNNYIQSWSQY